MSLLSQLKPKEGSTFSRKRRGRGHSTGLGGTSGKGHKGQKARTGGRVRWGFEGGQTPLMRRLPKFGFKNTNFRVHYAIINLNQLNRFEGEVTPEVLRGAGLLGAGEMLKILGNGQLSKPLVIHAHHFSEKAKAAIIAAGGKIEVLQKCQQA